MPQNGRLSYGQCMGQGGMGAGSTVLLRAVRVGLRGELSDVLVERGRIVSISPPGSGTAGSTAEAIDGAGGTLLRGLQDRHVHMVQWAQARRRIDLTATISAVDAVNTVAAALAARAAPLTELILGYGFRDGLWPDVPTKELLQQGFPDRPVALISNDLHAAWLSPAALQMMGVEHATGLLREDECFEVMARLSTASIEQKDAWVLEAATAAAALGVTNILDFEISDNFADWHRRAEQVPELPLRVEAAFWWDRFEAVLAAGHRTGDLLDESGLLTVGPCKTLLDGSLNTRTAYCHDPYPGISDPALAYGLLTQDPEVLTATMTRAAANGLAFAVHAIGDHANSLALDCFERSGVAGRIEHVQLVEDIDLKRFSLPGLISSVQPGHAPEDRDVADTHWAGRTGRAFAYRSLLGAGATLELGSDAPVARLDPWHGIAAAISRTDDDRPAWHPEQALTIDEALTAATGNQGPLSVGDVADLVLVGADPTDLSATDLRQIPVLATLVAGRFTHRTD